METIGRFFFSDFVETCIQDLASYMFVAGGLKASARGGYMECCTTCLLCDCFGKVDTKVLFR